MIDLTWSRIVLLVLVWLATLVFVAWRAYRMGHANGSRAGFTQGWREGGADERGMVEERKRLVAEEAERTKTANRRQGQLNRHAKAKGGAE